MVSSLEAADASLGTDSPTPARMYDYYLGGTNNSAVDRAAVEAMGPAMTQLLRDAAWENRRFLWRAVERVSREYGVRQFIDVGSGLPTVRNTHEVAQEADPDARVVYVDNDPLVISHAQRLLAGNGNTAIVSADVRNPARVLGSPGTQSLIDFSQPVAILIVALFHFITTPGHPRHVRRDPSPAEIVAAFRDHVAPGSCLVNAHITFEGITPEERALIEGLYDEATSPVVFRSRSEITELFEGWRPVPPGVVRPWAWPAEDPDSPRTSLLFGGVGVKE